MSGDVVVREAGLDDLSELTALFDGYRQFYRKAPDGAGSRSFLQDRLKARDSVLFIAAVGAHAAGFAQLYPLFSSVRMRRIWLLNDLFVDDRFRKRGVGEALLARAAGYALETGAAALELATERDNQPARRLYERLGWTRDTVFDHYSLTVDETA